MVPIRKGDGTGLAAKGYSQVRKGDGTVLWNAIPDSVVTRPDDDDSTSVSGDGIRFESSEPYSAMGFTISANTSGQETATIVNRETDTTIGSKDISGLSAGDSFTIEADIEANTTYAIIFEADGDLLTGGFIDNLDYPIVGPNGILQITSGDVGGSEDSRAHCVVSVGNVGFD